MGDDADIILGFFRPDRPGQLRTDGNQRVHEVLGAGNVRKLLCYQHHRPTESPDRHDESLVPTNKCQLGKVTSGFHYFFLCFVHVLCLKFCLHSQCSEFLKLSSITL